jgi:predicted TIM-barrel enzyme
MLTRGRLHVYPVIQVRDPQQALAQAAIAFDHEVAGIFLIDHDGDVDRLSSCIVAVRNTYCAAFLGANLIKTAPADALQALAAAAGAVPPIDALWSDDAGLDTGAVDQTAVDDLTRARADAAWAGLHFGGVAFKYQTFVPDEDLPVLGRLAREHCDVPTTSGPGTGQAISLERLRLLREGLGDHPLALASGVTVENISQVAPFITHVLVSTSISRDGGICPSRLSALLAAAERP